MNIEPAQLALRPAASADERFRFVVFASTRAEELIENGWSPAQQATFLKMQFAAQELSYTAAFPDAANSLVCLGATPVGIVVVNRTAGELRVVNLAFLPEYRGRGLGQRVLEMIQAEASYRGQPLRLQVLQGNRAQRLYERLGFVSARENGLYLQMEWRAAPFRSVQQAAL